MSMPTSAIAVTADGLTSLPGSDPPDHATARSPARWLNQPSAICDRPALCTHRNSTFGDRVAEVAGIVAPSGGVGVVVGDDEIVGGHVGEQEPRQRDREESADAARRR